MSEIWRELDGFSNYEFSNTGKARSKRLNREMSYKPKAHGYIRLDLRNDKREICGLYLHRIIAMTFIPNPENKPTVNHKNHDSTDNRVENLEWATIKEQNNHKRAPSKEINKLRTSRKVWRCSLDGEKLERYNSIRDAAKWVFETKGNEGAGTNISAVCLNKPKFKTAYRFKWVYDTSEDEILEHEIWRDIPEELINGKTGYKISDQGRIKNPYGKFLKGHIHRSGYKIVGIGDATSSEGRTYYLHKLLAQVFLPNYYGKSYVNHKDHDKSNCKRYNLEWVTQSENTTLAYQHYSTK